MCQTIFTFMSDALSDDCKYSCVYLPETNCSHHKSCTFISFALLHIINAIVHICLLQFIEWPLIQRIMIEFFTSTFVSAKVTLLWCCDLQSSTLLLHLLNLTLSLPTINDQGYSFDMFMIKQLIQFWASQIHSIKNYCLWKSCIHQDKIQLC